MAVILSIVALLLAQAVPVALARTTANLALLGQVTGVGGQPLTGAEVELFRFGTGRVAAVQTDDEGYFRFPDLDDTSVYWVRTWASGYRVAESNWAGGDQRPFLAISPEPLTAALLVRAVDRKSGAAVAGTTFDLERSGQGQVARVAGGQSGTARLEVPAGRDYVLRAWAPGRTPVLVVVPELAGGAAQSLTVELEQATSRLSGVAVAAPGGTPLTGAIVQAYRTGHGLVASAETGDDGSFAFDLPAGAEYQMRAAAPRHSAATAPAFTLAAGTERDLGGEDRLTLTPATGDLSGRLRDPDGKPVSGRAVWLQRKPFGTVASTETDDGGRFYFHGLPARPGVEYRVQVLPGDHYWKNAASAWMELAGGRVTDVALQLADGVIDDLGTTGGVIGTVTDAGGRAVSGAQVELWREGSGLLRTTTTGPQGEFRFVEVPSSRGIAAWSVSYNGYFLKVSAPGMFTTTLGSDTALEVASYRDTAASVILYPQKVQVAGRVQDGDGRRLPRTRVELTPEAGGTVLTATADASGRWRVAEADPLAVYRLEADLNGYRQDLVQDLVPDPAGAGTRDLTLRPVEAELSGQVTDRYGNPVADATVGAWSPGGELSAVTGADGRYTLTLPPGQSYLMTATATDTVPSGMAPKSVVADTAGGTAAAAPAGAVPVVSSVPGGHTEANLQIWAETGKVAGTLLSSDGQPARGVIVELMQEGRGVREVAETDGFGRYRFARVPGGNRYAVRVARAGYRHLGAAGLPPLFTLAPGTVENVHLEMTATQP